MWRINQLHRASRACQWVMIRVKDALMPFTILPTINIADFLAWTIIGPQQWTRVYDELTADHFGRPKTLIGPARVKAMSRTLSFPFY
jgi:hypothetical protein